MKKFLLLMAIAIVFATMTTGCGFKSEEAPLCGDLTSFTAKGSDGKVLKGIKAKDGTVLLDPKCEDIEFDEFFAWGEDPAGDVWVVRKDHKVYNTPFKTFERYRSKGFYEGTRKDSIYYYFTNTGKETTLPEGYLYREGSVHYFYPEYSEADTTTWVIATSDGEIARVKNPVAIIIAEKNTRDIYAYIVKEGSHYVGYRPSYNVGIEPRKEIDFNQNDWTSYLERRTVKVRTIYGCDILNLNYRLH